MAMLEHAGDWGRSAGSKLGWLIAGRLATAVLLSVIATFWTGQAAQSINKSLGLVTIVALLTILYSLIFRLSRNILYQARFQLTVDVLLVTWLVWNSNVIQSPYIALYIVIIAVSSLFLGPREAVVTSVGCAVAFTACALQITGLVGESDPSKLVRITAELTPKEASFTVEDEGEGFDIREIPDPCDPANLFRASGRGVLLIYNIMDEVEYNAQGNRVKMVKRPETPIDAQLVEPVPDDKHA